MIERFDNWLLQKVLSIRADGFGCMVVREAEDFYLDQSKSVEGDLESFRYANPHIVLTIRAADSTIYTAIWGPPYQVERAGVTKTTLKIGDHVIVTGAPPRNPTSREVMPVWEIQRPRDGWKRARRLPGTAPATLAVGGESFMETAGHPAPAGEAVST